MELIVGVVASKLAVRQWRRTRKELGPRFCPKMSFFDQVRGGIAKAVQIVSENHVFHEFPDCAQLSQLDRLSIKLKDPLIHDMLQGWHADHHFNSIFFVIRDENNHKKVVMEAELESGKGITLRNNQNKPIMTIKLPNNDPTSLGKLMHPAPATLFKVVSSPSPLGMNYIVQNPTTKLSILHIENDPVSLYQIGKAIGFFGSNCVYWLKAADGTVLGYVRPKLVLKSNTLVVKFMTNNRNPQIRATMLGSALLLFISKAYPQLKAMLQESIRKADGF